MIQVVNADCLEHMRTMPDASVDAVVTDPPYGLSFMGAGWDSFGGSRGTETVEERRRKGSEQSGEDAVVPKFPNSHGKPATLAEMEAFQDAMRPVFAEALRVCKPGAHMLCFGGTRTFHRMACAIEEAGWEVLDCIMWVYSSGFPHGMDVAKAIDKADGYVGEVVGTKLVDVGMQGGHMHAGRKVVLQQQQQHALSSKAKAWEGWNTRLKPAWEPIIVARKRIEGTVAANILEHGTGAMNIDACRVPTADALSIHGDKGDADGNKLASIYGKYPSVDSHVARGQELGRFPANVVHDGSEEVVRLFPESKGQQGDVRGTEPSSPTMNAYGEYRRVPSAKRGDTGSAARFFYCAKASKKERGEGNTHVTVKPLALMEWLVKLVCRQGGTILDPFAGSGTTLLAARNCGMDAIGIEREEEYVRIIEARLAEAGPVQTVMDV